MKRNETLGEMVDRLVATVAWDRVPELLPEWKWRQIGDRWELEKDQQHGASKACFGARPDRVAILRRAPHWVSVAGAKENGKRLLDMMNGGHKPTGAEFVAVARRLAEVCGERLPDRIAHEGPEASAARQERERSEQQLEAFYRAAAEALLADTEPARIAMAYLAKRGLDREAVVDLELGLCDPPREVHKAAEEFGPWRQWTMEGRIIIPWRDPSGRAATAWGRFVGDPPSDTKKLFGLAGYSVPGPLYLDRVKAARSADLVLVEGVLDAAVAQAHGDRRVVALGGVGLTDAALAALKAAKPKRVFVALDPDRAGDTAKANVAAKLIRAGLAVLVAPRLPDGLDPDEFILRDGIDGWRRWVDQSRMALVDLAEDKLAGVSPASPDADRVAAIQSVGAMVRELAREGDLQAVAVRSVVELVAERTGWPVDELAAITAKAERAAHEDRLAHEVRAVGLELSRGIASGKSAAELVEKAADKLGRLRPVVTERPPRFSVDSVLADMRNQPPALKTGWATLDDLLEARFVPGELTMVAARTGHGKTAAMANLAWRWLKTERAAVLVFSAEEPVDRWMCRLGALASVDLMNRKDGTWSKGGRAWTVAELRDVWAGGRGSRPGHNWSSLPEDFVAAELRSREDRLQIAWSTAWTGADIAAEAERWADEHGPPAAVLVDYVQKLAPPRSGPGKRAADRRDIEVSLTARELKSLAVRLSCPVVTGAQLNRAAIGEVQRAKLGACADLEEAIKLLSANRPGLHHLREGGLEQEADMVLAVMNYAADWGEMLKAGGEAKRRGCGAATVRMDVGLLKSRYGATGNWAPMDWTGAQNLLADPAGGVAAPSTDGPDEEDPGVCLE